MDILLEKGLEQNFIDEVLSVKKYKRITTTNYINIRDKNNSTLLKTLYEKYKIPNYKIAMLCNVSEATCRKYLNFYQIKNRGHYTGVNSDCDYFNVIDSFDKAYFLGFAFADGSVQDLSTSTSQRKVFSLTITKGDGYLLQKFLDYSKIKTKIHETHKNDAKPRQQMNIWSTKICNDLIKHGCIPNKSDKNTIFEIKDIPLEYINHFIRGYFDGDGISFSDGKMGFCGHKIIIEYIYKYLKQNVELISFPSITYNESNHIYYLVFGKQNAAKIAQFIYKDKQDLFLTRKYDIYRLVL